MQQNYQYSQDHEERERQQREQEEKMIRRPILGRNQSNSSQSSSSQSSNASTENIGQQQNMQLKQGEAQQHKSHSHQQHQHHHHHHDHHHHDHNCNHSHEQSGSRHSHSTIPKHNTNPVQIPRQQQQVNALVNQGDQGFNIPQNKAQYHDHRHGQGKYQETVLTPKQQQQINALINQDENNQRVKKSMMSQSSFNDDEMKALEDVYNDTNENVQKHSQLTSNEYSQKLKVLFKNCFHSNELENLDQSFKELQQLITEIKICDIQVLDSAFFKKAILLAQLDNPKRCLKVVVFFQQLFNDQTILKYLLKLSDHDRLVVDVINSYYILLEKFKNTKIEIDSKLSFNKFQNLLDTLGHYEEFKALIEQQTTLKSLDSIGLNSDQKEIFEMIKHYAKFKEISQKQEAIKYIVLLLGKCDNVIQQYKILVYHLTPVFHELSNVNYENNEFKILLTDISFLLSSSQILKHQDYKELKLITQETQNKQYIGGFLNSVLLMPSEIQLNLRALFMIRRMYYFFYDEISFRQLMEGPIVIILSNLAMFTKDVVQKKEPTLFLFKLLEDKGTLASLREKLDSNEYIKTLKENKYFGVMAKSYPYDIDVQYNFKNLNFQVNYPVYKKIDAGAYFFFNILVTKPDTIIYWSFKTLNYDVKFGLFKMETLSNELQIDQYEEEKQIKAIVKLQKADSHKEPVMAYSLVSLPGFYRIVFDNTYSYWREKELLYTIQVLEP